MNANCEKLKYKNTEIIYYRFSIHSFHFNADRMSVGPRYKKTNTNNKWSSQPWCESICLYYLTWPFSHNIIACIYTVFKICRAQKLLLSAEEEWNNECTSIMVIQNTEYKFQSYKYEYEYSTPIMSTKYYISSTIVTLC